MVHHGKMDDHKYNREGYDQASKSAKRFEKSKPLPSALHYNWRIHERNRSSLNNQGKTEKVHNSARILKLGNTPEIRCPKDA